MRKPASKTKKKSTPLLYLEKKSDTVDPEIVASPEYQDMLMHMESMHKKQLRENKMRRLKKILSSEMLKHFKGDEKLVDKLINVIDFEKRDEKTLANKLLTEFLNLLPNLSSDLAEAELQCKTFFNSYRNELELKTEEIERRKALADTAEARYKQEKLRYEQEKIKADAAEARCKQEKLRYEEEKARHNEISDQFEAMQEKILAWINSDSINQEQSISCVSTIPQSLFHHSEDSDNSDIKKKDLKADDLNVLVTQ